MDFYKNEFESSQPDLSHKAEILPPSNQIKERETISFNQSILYINDMPNEECIGRYFRDVSEMTVSKVVSHLEAVNNAAAPDAIIYASEYVDRMFFENLVRIRYELKERGFDVPVIIVNNRADKNFKKKVLQFGADDCIRSDFDPEKLNYWIDFLKLFKRLSKEKELDNRQEEEIKISGSKRIFDILIAGSVLLVLSPIMFLISLIIKLESRGSVFYVSKRAGMGYKVFNFLKFRSMGSGADKELSKLLHLNQYGTGVELKDNNGSNPVFFKIKDDPRITRFGKFLRDTSLDELPQLINVLKGEMSIVGNRPLPLYEAQQLTKDQAALRFMAPAGITGLWQVTKRGKAEMSEEERIALDVSYAKDNSFKKDLNLFFRTFNALVQEERV
ncbi:MAG: lipopolysaccharide/colanic/teichoic acid biosynthesis glycosyltransferase [Sediminicola sp.]|jgi:lipopolysaccharide/colanic/teichoic acid biosynthesis glycosyltransferase